MALEPKSHCDSRTPITGVAQSRVSNFSRRCAAAFTREISFVPPRRPGYTRLMSLERQLRCRSCGAGGKAALDMEFRPRD